MNYDYAKLAYAKVIELENQLNILKSQYQKYSFKGLLFSVNDRNSSENNILTKAKFKGNLSQMATVKIEANYLANGEDNLTATVTFNGDKIYQIALTDNILSCQFNISLSEENLLSVSVESSLGQFNLVDSVIEIEGGVEYFGSQKVIDSINANNKSYFSYVEDGTAYLYQYSGGAVSLVSQYSQVKCISICKIDSSSIAVMLINSNNKLSVKYISTSQNTEIVTYSVDIACKDGCIIMHNGVAKIYAIKNNRVIEIVIDENYLYSVNSSLITAKQVSGQAIDGDIYLIVTDFSSNKRLYVIN